jgi:hypothetical protein
VKGGFVDRYKGRMVCARQMTLAMTTCSPSAAKLLSHSHSETESLRNEGRKSPMHETGRSLRMMHLSWTLHRVLCSRPKVGEGETVDAKC